MTEHTPVGTSVDWEPTQEGVRLYMRPRNHEGEGVPYELSLPEVVELWNDAEEARMLARGYELVPDVRLIEVEDKWIVKVMGNDFRVASTFLEARSQYEGVWCALQDGEGREIVWPSEDLVTAYRPIV